VSEITVYFTDSMKGTTMNTTQAQIMNRIRRRYGGRGAVVTAKDFLDLASRDAVDQSLARLSRGATLNRVGRGLYYYPRVNQNLGIDVPPDADLVAKALGRQTGSRVVASSAMAANRLGLSTQIPAKHVYFTDGQSRNVKVGNQVFRLKHVAPNKMPLSDPVVGRTLSALDGLGPNPDEQVIDLIRQMLTAKQRKELLKKAQYATGWITDIARRVDSESHEMGMAI